MGSIPLGATRVIFFWLRSLMDRIRDSGSLGGGSIPFGATIKERGQLYDSVSVLKL